MLKCFNKCFVCLIYDVFVHVTLCFSSSLFDVLFMSLCLSGFLFVCVFSLVCPQVSCSLHFVYVFQTIILVVDISLLYDVLFMSLCNVFVSLFVLYMFLILSVCKILLSQQIASAFYLCLSDHLQPLPI